MTGAKCALLEIYTFYNTFLPKFSMLRTAKLFAKVVRAVEE